MEPHGESLSGPVSPVVTGGTLAAVSAHAALLATDAGLLLGDDLILWILLALGGAMFAGNVMALVRPPTAPRQEGDLERAPRGRSIVMAVIGFVVAMAGLAALVS
jgi:hypothetical protein